MNLVECRELALKSVKITGNVIGKYGIFEIEQKFLNNTKEVLEVNYTFPIIDTATVIGFSAKIGEKIIKGICKEKNEAIKEYHENIVKGNSAYMLNQYTDNIFNIAIGKVDKNEEVIVKLSYIDYLQVVDNNISLLIPTVVTPKYNSKITSRLLYGMVDYKVDYAVDFRINIDKSINVDNVTSSTHSIKVSDNKNVIKIEALKYDMSKDFKLDIKLKEECSSNAVFSKSSDNKYILNLSFMPEINDKYEDSEKEYIFIVDVSGSMSGKKIKETKKAVKECLRQLDEGDKFNIIPFESEYTAFEIESVGVNEENLKRANEFVDSLEPLGGTEILLPLKFALYEQSDDKVILLYTDGQVGNEDCIINYVKSNIKSSKLFAFGIDSSVNTSFIRKLAEVGNGKAEFISPGEKIDEKILRTFSRIQTPLIENLVIKYGNNKVIDEISYDKKLFNYEFFNIFCKLEDIQDDIVLSGIVTGKIYEWTIKKDDIFESKADLEKVYAKLQINRLEEYIYTMPYEKQEIYKQMIIDLSIKYGILTKYTSFISIYERDNKIFEVPKYQNVVLDEKSFEYDVAGATLDIPTFLRKAPILKSNVKKCFSFGVDEEVMDDFDEEDEDENIIEQKLENYFKENKIENIVTYILFAIYFYKNHKNILADNDIIDFLQRNSKELINNEKHCKLVYLLYSNSNENVKEYIYENIFSNKFKKIVDTGIKYNSNLEIKKLSRNKILDNIENDINRVLYTLI